MSDDGVHVHVEDSGEKRLSMSHPSVSLESRAIVTPGSCHHLEPDLVFPKKPERPGAHTVSIQNSETTVPFQGV